MADQRLILTERAVARLPLSPVGQYLAYDEKLKGLYVAIGRRQKTYMVKGDLRIDGKRAASLRISVGDTETMNVSQARAIASGYLADIKQGRHPAPTSLRRASSVKTLVQDEITESAASDGPSLREAWERYKTAMIKKKCSLRTIEGYEDHIVRVFKAWADKPIKELAENPDKVARKHDAITTAKGPYAANGAMRTLRAVYNHAWKKNKKLLPRDNPVDAVDWNKEARRNTGMGLADLPNWFKQLADVENPIRREFHLLTLLSASRPTALKQARLKDLDLRRRVLHIPAPKGGEDRAFDIPLSRQMILSLTRLIRLGRARHPVESLTWLFPAESEAGHISTTRENRKHLSKWGNELRQTYRTLATVARVSGVDAKLLMNHAIPGVNEGYITRHKILEDHLRGQQQELSNVIMNATSPLIDELTSLGRWLRPSGGRALIQDALVTQL